MNILIKCCSLLFSELPRILACLRELGMPCSTLTTRYFRDLFQDIQVIVPRRRIQFRKLVDGVEVPSGRLPVFLLATRAAEGCGVLDVMAVSTLPSKMRRVPKYRNFRSLS